MAEGGRKARSAGPSRGGHGGGHNGGAWKVAYADFTTAMMAFFLLLWILSSTSPEQKQSIANYFRDDGPFRDGGATKGGGSIGRNGAGILPHSGEKLKELDAKRLERAAQEIEQEMTALGGNGDGKGGGAVAGQVKVSVTDDGLVIEIADDADDAIFAVGGAQMAPKFEAIFDAVAGHLAGLPNRVRVEGYTDARQYAGGAAYTNWELSADRANAARRRLESHGLARERFESVVGYGDGYPAIPADPFAPANRRITMTVLKQEPKALTVEEPPAPQLGALNDDAAPQAGAHESELNAMSASAQPAAPANPEPVTASSGTSAQATAASESGAPTSVSHESHAPASVSPPQPH
jgi:chemotaxis protein MotB